MRIRAQNFAKILTLAGSMVLVGTATAATTITPFDNFTSDALYASWTSGTVVSGPNAYSITATGYGSNWKYIGGLGINGVGNTDLELTVTLSGPAAADGHLGPIVRLIDGDGSDYTFAWYGQTLGSHVLTMALNSPTSSTAGTVPGLDLANLQHMHMQLDPGGFGTTGAYTISWENLALTAVPEPSCISLLALASIALVANRRRHSR